MAFFSLLSTRDKIVALVVVVGWFIVVSISLSMLLMWAWKAMFGLPAISFWQALIILYSSGVVINLLRRRL
jgi:hypothetical protein